MKRLVIPVIIVSVLLVIFGLCSKPFLGDEIYHFRFAKDAYNSCSRPIFDSQYGTLEKPTILYTSPPFWSLSLAVLWKVTGGISVFVAQLYQVMFYIIVIICTYLIGKEIYSEKEARISSLLVATVPMIVSFSIILYTDIPVTALCLAGLLFNIKKKYLIAGCIWAIALLTKYNAGFFFPAAVLLLLFATKEKILIRLKNIFLIVAPSCILFFLNQDSKSEVFPEETLQNVSLGIISRATTFRTSEYLCSHLLNIKDLSMYFGIILLGAVLLYFLRKKYEKKDMYLGVFILSYMFCTFFMLGWNTDIRYFMPIVPLLCILFSKGITGINNIWIKRILILACIFQFIATASYVSYRRNLTPQLKEAFDFIKNNTPDDSLMLYPEPNIQEYAQRKLIWTNFKSGRQRKDVFWSQDAERIKAALSLNKIDYIVINKKRCYDDSEIRHFGGYPNSFVEKLPDYKFIKLIFNNKEIAVWEIEE